MPHFSIDSVVQLIETLLYSISTILYLPVLAALVLLVLYMLLCLGGFAGEWNERRRGLRAMVASAEADMAAMVAVSKEHSILDAKLGYIVQKADVDGSRRLDRVRFAVRVGPALGLMGTLIPMGISLAGLAQGNLPKMAESMTMAFTATVIGLGCSVTAYLLTLAREYWLRIDIADIAHAAETLLTKSPLLARQ